jgi:hypothetical protein
MTALLFKELAKFQQAMQGAKKDAKNPHFKSNYADLESVVQCIKDCSKNLNLSYSHVVFNDNGINYLKTIIAYSDGDKFESIESLLPLLTGKGGFNEMQALGSAITYAKRYTLQGLYGIPSEDDDGQAMTSQVKQTYQKPTPPPVKDIADIYTEISQATSIDALKVIANQYSRHGAIEQIKSALTARKLNLQKPSIEDSEKLLNDALFTKD